MKRWLLALLLLAVVWLGWVWWYGDNGWVSYKEQKRLAQEERQENIRLHEQVVQEQQYLDTLKNDEGALEGMARSQLGLVGENEVIYISQDGPDGNDEQEAHVDERRAPSP